MNWTPNHESQLPSTIDTFTYCRPIFELRPDDPNQKTSSTLNGKKGKWLLLPQKNSEAQWKFLNSTIFRQICNPLTLLHRPNWQKPHTNLKNQMPFWYLAFPGTGQANVLLVKKCLKQSPNEISFVTSNGMIQVRAQTCSQGFCPRSWEGRTRSPGNEVDAQTY